MKGTTGDDKASRIAAALVTLAILVFMARVLMHVPSPGQRMTQQATRSAMQVVFLRRPQPQPMAPEPAPTTETPNRPRAAVPTSAVATPPRAETASAPPRSEQPSTAAALYARDGRVRMSQIDPMDRGYAATPPGTVNQRELDDAKRIMDPPNPIDYQETRFAKDWKSDGTLGQVMGQAITRGTRKLNEKMFGSDHQTAVARPPPDVRFNPALAENKADLGSEATGDAYKAAPIAHEPVPDLKGEASRRIRAELAKVEALPSHCGTDRRKSLLAPARAQLAALEKAEHALNNGADPVLAEQLLPRQADSAYDLARRALWYARQQLAMCPA